MNTSAVPAHIRPTLKGRPTAAMRCRVRLRPITTKPATVKMFMPKRMSWVSIRLAAIVSAPCQREPNLIREIGRYRDLSRKSLPLISTFPSSVNSRPARFPLGDGLSDCAGERGFTAL